MGNQASAPHEPLDRATVRNISDVHNTSTKPSLRASFSRRTRAGGVGMDRLRRSFRESFRRRKGGGDAGSDGPESTRPHQWHADEAAVRGAVCAFPVKYLGCVEVFESRGMQVCEEALKVLRNSRRRPVRAILNVSGDGLRVVEEETKGLIVDQTIEKVSFCAPDRNHERGFSYICRDGTTRRWMCHGFLASRDSGERLSHAVGCAFASCLERKQRRDKECAVSMSIDAASGAFTRQGSFRPSGITERKVELVSSNSPVPSPPAVPAKPIHNPFAIERPHAAPHMLERQGSFRGFSHLNNNSPFKRQMSLRLNDLPSNLERQRLSFIAAANASNITPVPEAPLQETAAVQPMDADPVAAMCRQLARGLQALAAQGNEEMETSEAPALAPLPAISSLPDPEQWLGRISQPSSQNPHIRAPALTVQMRAKSFAGVENSRDPFNSDWQPIKNPATNPFLQQTPFPIN